MTVAADVPPLQMIAIALQPAVLQELMVGAATLVVLLGVWLCWGAPRYRMSIEESVKDGKLTGREAERRIRWNQWVGPCVTTVGVGLLTYAVTR